MHNELYAKLHGKSLNLEFPEETQLKKMRPELCLEGASEVGPFSHIHNKQMVPVVILLTKHFDSHTALTNTARCLYHTGGRPS